MKKFASAFLKQRIPLFIFALISLVVFIIYLYFVNLSFDTVLLFITSKLFYGEWLKKGIFPFFNPDILNGVPYAFDLGMNHFHPLSLLFLLPFPLSFALWSAANCFLFLIGFYFLFLLFTNKKMFAFFLTLTLFFSGSGFFLRMNNPIIFSVIAHYGIFLFSLSYLKKGRWQDYAFPLIVGVLLTLSGHIQFVVYGYIMGLTLSIFYLKIPIKRVFLYFIFLSILTSWYYILSFPLVFESTRLTLHKTDIDTGPLYPLQLLQLVFPFFWGSAESGSKWGVGLSNVILSSVIIPILAIPLLVRRLFDKASFTILLILFLVSLGLIPIPFFRGAGQIFILIVIFILISFAKNINVVNFLEKKKTVYFFSLVSLCALLSALFFKSSLFQKGFFYIYGIAKHGNKSLFFDNPTVMAIGNLISLSLFPLIFLGLCLLWNRYIQKNIILTLIFFVTIEGIFINYFQNNFFPISVLNAVKKEIPANIDERHYRVQSAAEVVPYVGFYNYFGGVIFRPPFSKEPTTYTKSEQKSYIELIKTFKLIPSSWSMVGGVQSIQGYNTFVPNDLAHYFDAPSKDYKQVYSYILDRNPLFAQSEKGSHINSIETSRVTLYDPRWEKLGVRYFISDRPLKEYKLLEADNGRYVYENVNTLPIYRMVSGNKVSIKSPYYEDPNQWKFNISKEDVGKEFQMVMNPGGFAAKLNGQEVPIKKEQFLLRIPLQGSGELVVYYSPVRHLNETISKLMKKIQKTSEKKEKATIVFINQVRGTECCQKGSLISFKKQLQEFEKYHFPSGFLFRYDALVDQKFVDVIRESKYAEPGVFFEITPSLARAAEVHYRGIASQWFRPEFALLTGYTQQERAKLIDVFFEEFKRQFNHYPSIAGSWMVDSFSVNYMVEKYHLLLYEITKEQYGTDSYVLYGGVEHEPYIPRKKWIFLPAADSSDGENIVVVRQTISDPVSNYGDATTSYTSQPNDYMQRLGNIQYFNHLLTQSIFFSKPEGFALLGLENNMGDSYQNEYLKQIKTVSMLASNNDFVSISSPSDYAQYKLKKGNDVYAYYGENEEDKNQKAYWVGGSRYRVRIKQSGSDISITDLRTYSDNLSDPYNTATSSGKTAFWEAPFLVDGSKNFVTKKITLFERIQFYIDSIFKNNIREKALLSPERNDFLSLPSQISLPKKNSDGFIDITETVEGLSIQYKTNINTDVVLSFSKDKMRFQFSSPQQKEEIQKTIENLSRIKPDIVSVAAEGGPSFVITPVIISDANVQQPNEHKDSGIDEMGFKRESYSVVYDADKVFLGRNPVRLVLKPIKDFGYISSKNAIHLQTEDGGIVPFLVYEIEGHLGKKSGMYYVDINESKPGTYKFIMTADGVDLLLKPVTFAIDCKKELHVCVKNPLYFFNYISVKWSDILKQR